MNILIVSYYFPPFNAVGAVRVGKWAKYLTLAGHDVKILTVNDQPWMPSLPLEVSADQVIRTSWLDVNKPIQMLLGGKKNVALRGYERAGALPNFIRKLGYFYKDCINFPDGQIGWYPFAIRAGRKLLAKWRPDFILASSSPMTSCLIARKLAQLFSIPWVADLRDLWAGNHNSDLYQSNLRRWFDKRYEKRIFTTAAGLITVSDPLAEQLKRTYDLPVQVIMNGYDLADYPNLEKANTSTKLCIVYTGIIHPKKRDPAPLFSALTLLGEDAKKIQVDFYGRSNEIIKSIGTQYGVGNLVNCYYTVPYHESLCLQFNADVLLLLTFNSDEEKGVVTTKFFEYLGARRPILLIGCVNGVIAGIMRARNIGLATNNSQEIADFLKKALLEKEQNIRNKLPEEAIRGFSRKEQTAEVVVFLKKLQTKQQI